MRSYHIVDILVARCLIADGQLPATFCTTARQNFPSVLGCHARTETMLVVALPAARLKRAFHCILPEMKMRIFDIKNKNCKDRHSL